MEKKSITGKDILRMDGLLPPTKRLPVCDAVTANTDKKKEKKWSLGGILKRISSIRDYESSSNEEEIMYCKREPKDRIIPTQKRDCSVLRPTRKNQCSNRNKAPVAENNTQVATDPSNVRRGSVLSRSSDESLDGLGKKIRKNKLKARAEAKRDRICGDSSSDEDSRRSSNSLTRLQNDDCAPNSQKNSSCNRKSRAARTERYIKRHSKEDGHSITESLTDLNNKRNSLDYVDENERSASVSTNGSFRPPIHPRRHAAQANSHTFPAQRSTESLREPLLGFPDAQTRSSIDLTKYPRDRCVTDMNQNTYAKPAKVLRKDDNSVVRKQEQNYFQYPANIEAVKSRDCDKIYGIINRSACPPDPPPRDPRYRSLTYCSYSLPYNGKYPRAAKIDAADVKTDVTNEAPSASRNLWPCDCKDDTGWYGSVERCLRRSPAINPSAQRPCNLKECTNNKHNSTMFHVNEFSLNETEAMKCQRRNDRNDQLNSDLYNYNASAGKNKLSPNPKQDIQDGGSKRDSMYKPINNSYCENEKTPEKKQTNTNTVTAEDDVTQRRRSSKNLEEALSELEAIYNSLRLGDEDLLDRAERRSMEEFSSRHAKNGDIPPLTSPDSSDRTKDDMAYRRMHPKERPTSLSEIAGQAALSNISYLMASPILSRKDAPHDYRGNSSCPARSDEPDVTRDDVVYRSINRANNTLKVIDPQPPFGIPLGPVTTATESDYLHTTPSKSDHPRSSYIPQCEPDIVTDDLAYRTLRKDASTSKNAGENKTAPGKDSDATFGVKKKRAVRSLSANLYGLINQDRIHLRTEPSLLELRDEINETTINVKPFHDQSECFRRVVSDGELSDYDTRWRIDDPLKRSTDINGNVPVSGAQRRKLRVYVSSTARSESPGRERERTDEPRCSTASDVLLSPKALEDEFWQDYLRLESNGPVDGNKETEADFTAYSQLCQDLVNLIKGPDADDAEANPIEAGGEPCIPISKPVVKINDPEHDSKADEPSILHIQSLGSQYSKEIGSKESNPLKEANDTTAIDELTESMITCEKDDAQNTEDNTLDFYLRLADENVKLIAEAFSSVADHLRDSRLGHHRNPSTPRRSEIENDTATHETSTRSSVVYSQDDGNDERSLSSGTNEISDAVHREQPSATHREREDKLPDDPETHARLDPELDLSRAVHDLQLAAASLCRHEKEIDELESRLKRTTDLESSGINVQNENDESVSEGNCNVPSGNDNREQERDQTETLANADPPADKSDSGSEGESKEPGLDSVSYMDVLLSAGMRVSYVTNLITVMITTYPMVLLACFLALLLATIAAS